METAPPVVDPTPTLRVMPPEVAALPVLSRRAPEDDPPVPVLITSSPELPVEPAPVARVRTPDDGEAAVATVTGPLVSELLPEVTETEPPVEELDEPAETATLPPADAELLPAAMEIGPACGASPVAMATEPDEYVEVEAVLLPD